MPFKHVGVDLLASFTATKGRSQVSGGVDMKCGQEKRKCIPCFVPFHTFFHTWSHVGGSVNKTLRLLGSVVSGVSGSIGPGLFTKAVLLVILAAAPAQW